MQDTRLTDGRPADSRLADNEEGTRQRVLQLVATTGPTTAADLARALGVTQAAVRRHLIELLDADMVAVHEAAATGPARRGRPARRYVVTGGGQRALPAGYSTIASQAMTFLAEVAGDGAVEEFAARRATALEERYAEAVEAAGADPQARAAVLADLLADDGYAASTRPVPGLAAVQLCQGHCPVQQVAAEFPQLCEAETVAFSRLLGVHVQRLSTLAGGGHVCTTNVPVPGATAPADRDEESRTTPATTTPAETSPTKTETSSMPSTTAPAEGAPS